MVNERFDPHTAKKRMGHDRRWGYRGRADWRHNRLFLTKPLWMLPVLCGMHLVCGWMLRSLRPDAERIAPPSKEAAGGLGAGTRLLAKLPYLRHLALLVLVGAAGATMIDQVFKTQAHLVFPQPEELQRFFALFYTAASLVGWVIHTALTRLLLEKSGLGVTVSVLPATVTLGSLGAALLPGFPSASIARGSELVAHSTLFRSAYELFYTSVPPAEKRSAKQIIDVGFERLGDMLGAVINRGLLRLSPALANPAMLVTAATAGLLRALDRAAIGPRVRPGAREEPAKPCRGAEARGGGGPHHARHSDADHAGVAGRPPPACRGSRRRAARSARPCPRPDHGAALRRSPAGSQSPRRRPRWRRRWPRT